MHSCVFVVKIEGGFCEQQGKRTNVKEKKSGIKGKKKEKKKKKIQKEPFTPSQITTLVRKKW